MATTTAQSRPEEWYETATGVVPTEAWYGLGLAAAFASLGLWLVGEHDWSGFVGRLSPVFLILALFHRRVPRL